MEDFIKIEEIKMFLGTELFVFFNADMMIGTVDAVGLNSLGMLCFESYNRWIGGFFRPCVIPLNNISDKDIDYLKKEPKDSEGYACLDTLDVDDHEWNLDNLSFNSINYLASKHYDIFNWISRGCAYNKLEYDFDNFDINHFKDSKGNFVHHGDGKLDKIK